NPAGSGKPAVSATPIVLPMTELQSLTVGGRNWVSLSAPLPGINNTPVGNVEALLPLAEVSNARWRAITGNLLVGVVFLALAVLASLWLTELLTRPVRRLTSAVRAGSQAGSPSPALRKLATQADEVGELAGALLAATEQVLRV